MRAILPVMAALLTLGCAPDDTAPACELGRAAACVCASGAAGAQECGPSGAWSPCVCAAPDAGAADVTRPADADVGSDAAPVADVRPVDATETTPDVHTAQDTAADTPRDLGIYDAPGLCLVPGMVACGPDAADCTYLSDGRGLPARNCGACGVTCASGEMCRDGACVNPCPAGRIYCIGNLDLSISCVDPMRSATNCGGCRRACAAGMGCEGGVCVR